MIKLLNEEVMIKLRRGIVLNNAKPDPKIFE